ncbi:MAG: hypothetical protein IKD13_07150 [Firmicutes bacterium]|nr:hypothetical protein [Bacillota bacterium]
MNDEMRKMNHSEEDQEILQLLEMLAELPEAPVPDEFDLRLRRALKEENAKRKAETVTKKRTAGKPAWKKWSAMAACLMIGFLSFQMIQGGIGADMTEGAVADEGIGGSSGPQAVMEAEIKKGTNDVSNGYSLTQDEPVLISDILEQNVDSESGADGMYGLAPESRLGAGIGIDGEVIQISRGQNGSEDREAFAADCDQILRLMAEAIAEGDRAKLTEAVTYKNGLEYSEEEAEQVLKLYGDLFTTDDAELSWKCISLTGWSRTNIYRLTGVDRTLAVFITETPEGLHVMEPVMEHSGWLYDQIGEQDFTLVDVIYTPETGEMEFLVDLKDKKEEVRSFVWKETESL